MYQTFSGKQRLQVWTGLLLGWAILAGPLVIQAQQGSIPVEILAYPNIIAYNGKVLTVDDDFTTAQAFAVRDGKFLAIGSDQRIRAMS